MKEGWEYKKIKDIGSVIAGTTPNTNVAEYWDGNLCWISPAELDGSHYLYDSRKKITEAAVKAKSLKLLPQGTVILSSRAPIGKVVINKVPTYCNQGFKCVVCGKEIYNEFLYWWFWGKTEYLNSLGTGATFKEISKKVVEEILIPVPPLSEQQSIVDYLDSAFAKIDAMKANAEKSLNEAKALFQATLKEMLEPKEGWEYIALSSVCKVQNGFAFNSKLFNESNNGLPLIRIRDIKRGYSLTCTSEICSDEFFVEDGDMLIGMDGDFNIGEWKGGHALLNQRVCKLIPSEKILAKFIFYFIPEALQRINDKTAFSTVKHLSSKQVNAILLPILPLSEQQSIVAHLDFLKSKVDRLQENYDMISQECDALKQAILRQVFD